MMLACRIILILATLVPLSARGADEPWLLPVDVEAEVLEIESALNEARRMFDHGALDDLGQAVELCQQVLETRLTHQTEGPPDEFGKPVEWWEVLEARRRLAEFEHLGSMSEFSRDRYREAIAQDGELQAAVEQEEWPQAHAIAEGQRRTLFETAGASDHKALRAQERLAYILQQQRQLDDARSLYRSTLLKRRAILGPHHPRTLQSKLRLGLLLVAQGRVVEPEHLFRECAEGRELVLGADHLDTLHAQRALGRNLADQGRFAESELLMRRVLAGYERVQPDSRHTWSVQYDLGIILVSLGEFADAESMLRDVLKKRRDDLGPDNPSTLESMSGLGALLMNQGRVFDAHDYLTEALSRQREVLGDQAADTLTTLEYLARLKSIDGRLFEAESLQREALDGWRFHLGENHPITLRSREAMGLILLHQGDLESAEDDLRLVLSVRRFSLGHGHLDTLGSHHHLGVVLMARGLLEDAESHLSIASEERRAILGAMHLDTLASIRQLGLLYRLQGRLLEAEGVLREALQIAKKLRVEGTGSERARAAMSSQVDLARITSNLAIILATNGGYEDALTVVEEGRGRALLDLLVRSEEDIAAAVVDKDAFSQRRKNESAARRGVLTAQAEMLGLVHGDLRVRADGSLDDDERNRRISRIRADLVAAQDKLDAERLTLSEATAEIELALQEHLPDAQPLTGSEIRSRLEPGDIAVGYTWADDAVLLLLAQPVSLGDEGISAHFITTTREETDKLAKVASEILLMFGANPGAATELSPDQIEIVAGFLEVILPSDLRAKLAGASRIVFVADGPLVGIPLDALGPVVGDPDLDDTVHQYAHASSMTVYLNRRSVGRSMNYIHGVHVVALGDPIYHRNRASDGAVAARREFVADQVADASQIDVVRLYGGFLPRLQGTRDEVNGIRTAVEGAGGASLILMQSTATLPELEENAGVGCYLHLATHGLVGSRSRPYDAGVALTEPEVLSVDDTGFLTLNRLLRNWQGKLRECHMVVLSACQTHVGVREGDAMMSLPWGFFYAGAPTVVASLWNVDDEATKLFMVRFYENLIGSHTDERAIGGEVYRNGHSMPKAHALQEAKQFLRTYSKVTRGVSFGAPPKVTQPYRHPYYWAPFILLGDPGS